MGHTNRVGMGASFSCRVHAEYRTDVAVERSWLLRPWLWEAMHARVCDYSMCLCLRVCLCSLCARESVAVCASGCVCVGGCTLALRSLAVIVAFA